VCQCVPVAQVDDRVYVAILILAVQLSNSSRVSANVGEHFYGSLIMRIEGHGSVMASAI